MSETREGLLAERAVRIGVHAADKQAAVRACGELLVEIGAVEDGYVAAMLDREQEISTYMGEGVAIPHGTNAGRALVRHDALAVIRFAEPVDWGEGAQVVLCVAIAALGEGHLDILADLAEILLDPERARALREATEANDLIRLLEPDDARGTDTLMKVARFYGPGDIRIEDAPEPTAGAGEVKIRVRNCSTCGTDLKIFRSGHFRIEPPRVMGHEIAGEIVEVGEGVAGHAVGERVQVIAAIPDGTCDECRRGRQTVCRNQESMGYQYDGGFAEYMIVPRSVLAVGGLNRIPDSIGFDEASVAEPLACVLNGQELARVGDGDVVVVFGAGPIGCLHVRLARSRGAAQVILVEVNRERLDLAAALVRPDETVCAEDGDVVEQVLKLTDGRGADVVITAAAAGAAQEQGLRIVAPQGRISFFGGLPKDKPTITLDSNLVHYSELTIVGANGSSPAHNARALELIASGAVPVKDLITHRLPLDSVLEALDVVARGEAIKVTIEP